ncbi:MAG TPA: hypothetical protein VG603_04370 [Chitinophagales bacterium]|nr:hypothetical protein [Chitinophagales bacterium]
MKELHVKPQYVTDYRGKKLSVLLSINDYKKIIEKLEELHDLRLYDKVKALKEEKISLENYLKARSSKNGKV